MKFKTKKQLEKRLNTFFMYFIGFIFGLTIMFVLIDGSILIRSFMVIIITLIFPSILEEEKQK